MTVSFWCVSVSCDGLTYSGFQSFSMGGILPFIRGVTGLKPTDRVICTSLLPGPCVTEFFLNSVLILL